MEGGELEGIKVERDLHRPSKAVSFGRTQKNKNKGEEIFGDPRMALHHHKSFQRYRISTRVFMVRHFPKKRKKRGKSDLVQRMKAGSRKKVRIASLVKASWLFPQPN